MLSLNRNKNGTCENSSTQTTKHDLARLKKKCSVGTLYCTHCPTLSTKCEDDLKYHIAKKH